MPTSSWELNGITVYTVNRIIRRYINAFVIAIPDEGSIAPGDGSDDPLSTGGCLILKMYPREVQKTGVTSVHFVI